MCLHIWHVLGYVSLMFFSPLEFYVLWAWAKNPLTWTSLKGLQSVSSWQSKSGLKSLKTNSFRWVSVHMKFNPWKIDPTDIFQLFYSIPLIISATVFLEKHHACLKRSCIRVKVYWLNGITAYFLFPCMLQLPLFKTGAICSFSMFSFLYSTCKPCSLSSPLS